MSLAQQQSLPGILNGNDIEHILDDVQVPFIALSYEGGDASALKVATALRPEWNREGNKIELIRFTDGITNTLLKVINPREGQTKEEIDQEAILLRAYGHGTDILIDRQRETQNHELLTKYGLAPELLARFNNGMLYRFIRGSVTHPNDLRRPPIYNAVARRLAEWHVRVPCIPETPHQVANGHGNGNGHANGHVNGNANGHTNGHHDGHHNGNNEDKEARLAAIDHVAPGKPIPNVWTVMQKWIYALPTETDAQRIRQENLQKELERIVLEFSQRPGLGKDGLVFAHCDLLSGNIIVLPKDGATTPNPSTDTEVIVSFIDYEYAVPSPAAFDIANHFAEWGGFDCDFSVLPTRSQRRDFISRYIDTYYAVNRTYEAEELPEQVQKLMDEVDLYRGVPGFYWGIWALIQATISDINFDYASYAELRLGEYWAWREEVEGTRAKEGKEMPLRERRWAQESD